MKLLTPLIVSSVILGGCSSSISAGSDSSGDFLCVPGEYEVSVPGPGASDDGFDPEGGGYGTSILLSGKYMAQEISGYKAKVRVGESEQHQSLYVMLAPDSHFQRSLSEIRPTRPLDEYERLFREDTDSLTWEVLEKTGGNLSHWGTCADQFTDPESFDCQRVLRIHDLVLTYTIDRANLHFHQKIDNLLKEKVNQWRCDSGTIPIER